jgi:hypothetical protein
MTEPDELAQVAEQLRRQGIDAWHEVVYGTHMFLEGLDIGEDFYPLWELISPENRDDFERRDFAAIKARRGADWSVEPPRRVRAADV